jgi:hypothetical protein
MIMRIGYAVLYTLTLVVVLEMSYEAGVILHVR